MTPWALFCQNFVLILFLWVLESTCLGHDWLHYFLLGYFWLTENRANLVCTRLETTRQKSSSFIWGMKPAAWLWVSHSFRDLGGRQWQTTSENLPKKTTGTNSEVAIFLVFGKGEGRVCKYLPAYLYDKRRNTVN